MLKTSFRPLLLSALISIPTAAFAQDKTESSSSEETATQNVVIEVEEVTVEEDSSDKKNGQKTIKVVTDKVVAGKDTKKPIELKIQADGKHEIRLIEIDGEDMPKQLGVIMKRLNTLKGGLKDGEGKPQIMSFTIDADGSLKGDSTAVDKSLQQALDSIAVSIDGKDVEEHVIQILRNAGPGKDQVKMLKNQTIDLKNLTDKLANIKGTISISTSASSSSTSEDGKKPNVVTNSQIRIIGPDGNIQKMEFNGTPFNEGAIEKAVEEALKKAGRDVPDDVKKRVDEALKRARERSASAFGKAAALIEEKDAGSVRAAVARAKADHERAMAAHNNRIAEVQDRVTQQSGKSIEKKLDQILKQLSKMQEEIDELKKK